MPRNHPITVAFFLLLSACDKQPSTSPDRPKDLTIEQAHAEAKDGKATEWVRIKGKVMHWEVHFVDPSGEPDAIHGSICADVGSVVKQDHCVLCADDSSREAMTLALPEDQPATLRGRLKRDMGPRRPRGL